MASSSLTTNSLLTFSPLISEPEHNLVRIERTNAVDELDGVHAIAGGEFAGVVVKKPASSYEDVVTSFPCSFYLTLKNKEQFTKQEKRTLSFRFADSVSELDRPNTAQSYIRELMSEMPKEYAGFIIRTIKLMKKEAFFQIRAVDISFRSLAKQVPMIKPAEYEADTEIENVNVGHVQDVLEHAFPSAISIELIANSLRCSSQEVENFLAELERKKIAVRDPNNDGQWLRVDSISSALPMAMSQPKKSPTIAIISCLFVEKQCLDEMINDRSTIQNSSKSGESNLYSIGDVAGHRIVANKLSIIGVTREAITSAGSLTTRLLGAFPQIEHVIIVGVGGGVPHLTDPEQHIRLGDVVISYPASDEARKSSNASYVYAHNFVMDRNKEYIDGFSTRQWAPKENTLAEIVKKCNKSEFMAGWKKNINELVVKLNESACGGAEMSFSRPSPEFDCLALPTSDGNYINYAHPNAERKEPLFHFGPVGSMIVLRKKASPKKASSQIPSTPSKVKGKKSVAEKLQNGNSPATKDAMDAGEDLSDQSLSSLNLELREKFIADYGLKSFDEGFDPVIEAIHGSRIDSWVFIRGISDYQQGTTKFGRNWQPYASATAAAMVKTILEHLDQSAH